MSETTPLITSRYWRFVYFWLANILKASEAFFRDKNTVLCVTERSICPHVSTASDPRKQIYCVFVGWICHDICSSIVLVCFGTINPHKHLNATVLYDLLVTLIACALILVSGIVWLVDLRCNV